MKITEEQQTFYGETAKTLKGSARRLFMASVVHALGKGGQRYAEKIWGWNRRTIRKGMAELTSGVCQVDQFAARGRKRAEARLPNLLVDLREIMDNHATVCQSTLPVKRPLSAAEVRRCLIEQKGYATDDLPCTATIRTKLNELGYYWHALPQNRREQPTAATLGQVLDTVG